MNETKKIVAIGDIHASTAWQSVVNNEDADVYVFIGDYFDTFEDVTPEEQYHNFENIVEFQKTSDADVILLLGNHDISYMGFEEARCSGYDHIISTYVTNRLNELINARRLQICYEYDGVLFSHAGITKTWVDENLDDGFSVDAVNECFYYTPRKFFFKMRKFSTDPYGDDPYQSPIWVRPKSLVFDKLDDYIQVVGHTRVKKINTESSHISNIIIIDTFDNPNSDDEYLVYDNGKFESKIVQ